MHRLDLVLLAVRTMDVDRMAEFYGCLGFRFAYKDRGHRFLVAGLSRQRLVVEIHAVDRPEDVDRTTRLGFAVPDFQVARNALTAFEAAFVEDPLAGRGLPVVVKDPDGRLLDLYERDTLLSSIICFFHHLGKLLTLRTP